MKPRFPLAQLFSAAVSVAIVSLSCTALAWHTEDAMKKTGDISPSSAPSEAGTAAKGSGPADAPRPAGSREGAQYGVEYVPGGIDRVILSKRDNARNLCIQVTLASPGMAEVEVPAGKVDLPPNWSLERAIMVRDATACAGTLRRWPQGAINATEVIGSVRWGSSPAEKTAVDLRLSFPAHGAEPAFTERLSFKR